MKYIIKDWAGNEMGWGEFDNFDDADDSLQRHVEEQLTEEGIDVNAWVKDDRGYDCLKYEDEIIELRDEYIIVGVKE